MESEASEERGAADEAPGGEPEADDGAASARGASFAAAIERVSKAVVALRVQTVRPFDSEGRGCSQATGFVVDAERGLILTNRHVVGGGPLTADATFLSKEEVSVVCVYR
jgi:S1-C subfamily serine protease